MIVDVVLKMQNIKDIYLNLQGKKIYTTYGRRKSVNL